MNAPVTQIHGNRGSLPIDYEAVIVSLEEDIATLNDRVTALEKALTRLTGGSDE